MTPEEKHKLLQNKRRDFYDGLLRDMLSKEAYSVAQIVYSEKMREKFEMTVDDQLTGLEIFSSQHKIDEFTDLYTKLMTDKDAKTIITQ